MDLNDLLNRSAPPVAPRSPELTKQLDDLVVGAEATARSAGRRYRATLVSALTVGVLGAGTVGAMATGVVSTPGWVPWTTEAGATCELEFHAVPDLGPGAVSPTRTYTADEERQAVAEANRFLDEFDYGSIDVDEAIEKWGEAEGGTSVSGDPDAIRRNDAMKQDTLELGSVGREVEARLAKHLDEKGLPSGAVAVEQGWRCSP